MFVNTLMNVVLSIGLGGPGTPTVTPAEATAIAVNRLTPIEDGFRLRHPDHRVDFTSSGVTVRPRHGGPTWHWRLTSIESDGRPFPGVPVEDVEPERDDATTIRFCRGPIVEQYVLKTETVEQVFVIHEPPPTTGALRIEGVVDCAGRLERTSRGWRWRTGEGHVSLGRAIAFDADGRTIPVETIVDAAGTRLVIDGETLRHARYPVTIDPEIGTNDIRLSDMGPDGDLNYDARDVAVAYNDIDHEYLVVWEGDDDTGGLVDGELEIFGQRVDAATGLEIGMDDFRISSMGPDGDPAYDAGEPDVVWNPVQQECLVVWSGDDDSGDLVENESEIFAQRLDATGAQVGPDDFRISAMGPNGDMTYDAEQPAVCWNSVDNQYLVVWEGDDDALLEGEFEIYGQLLDATGAQIGLDDFRISDLGPDGIGVYDAEQPAVTWNAIDGEYLVVWHGDDDQGGLIEGELEIFGQRLDAAGGELGANDFRISDMGPDGDGLYDGENPAVTWNGTANQYLVVWEGDDNENGLVSGEQEIFGQQLAGGTGIPTGPNDFRISQMGPDGDVVYDAQRAAVTYNAQLDEYLVVWQSDDDTGLLVNGEIEIYAQRLDGATGAQVGLDDVRLSTMGPLDGDTLFDAGSPAVASGADGYLVTWDGDDGTLLADDEHEAYGQLVDGATGLPVAPDDIRLSAMGPDGDLFYDARRASVAYNPIDDLYLVVWEGDDEIEGEEEIYGQFIDGLTGEPIGTNDFRISDLGPAGVTAYDAERPDVIHNATVNEFLVVWQGDDDGPGLVEGETEIYGQRLDGASGLQLGLNDFRISDMGVDGVSIIDAGNPAVAWNATDNEYLVVWRGDDQNGEDEIYGQRLDGVTGGAVGPNDFRISDMGTDGNTAFDASTPDVAWNAIANEYLVVWHGDDDSGDLVEGELEIYGQRLTADGIETGVNDFRISDMGPEGEPFDGEQAAITWNATHNEYLVVWAGDDDVDGLVNGETEIFGQRLTSTGSPVGLNDFRISAMGPDGDTGFDAASPAVSYSAAEDAYLVTWQADDDTLPFVDEEEEIFGQLLSGTDGAPIGEDDFRLSDMGPDGNMLYDARRPAIAWNATHDEFLIVWTGDESAGALTNDELEIYGQRYSPAAPCPGDTNGDGAVDVLDLVNVILAWGGSDPAADVNDDGTVDVTDLVQIILGWGSCP